MVYCISYRIGNLVSNERMARHDRSRVLQKLANILQILPFNCMPLYLMNHDGCASTLTSTEYCLRVTLWETLVLFSESRMSFELNDADSRIRPCAHIQFHQNNTRLFSSNENRTSATELLSSVYPILAVTPDGRVGWRRRRCVVVVSDCRRKPNVARVIH